MVYGDLQAFDILVFAGIAAFLIYRLRSVLGKKSGFEKKTNQKTKEENNNYEIKKNTPQLKENESKFISAYEAMESFDHKQFLEGAKFAFETIINAFNNGDKKTIEPLLTKDVYRSFETAIDSGNNNPDLQFYSLNIDGVEDVVVEAGMVSITIKITSEQFKKDDESSIIKKQDVWTFQKQISSESTVWFLSST